MMEIIFLISISAIFILSFIGIVAPVIPSLPLAWGGIVLYGFATGFSIVDARLIIITGLLALVGTVMDFVANILGAKVLGASWVGLVGALVGSVVGFFLGAFFGIILGAFLGTICAEYLYHKTWKVSLKAALGTIIGFFFGVVLKIVFLLWMMVLFYRAVL